MKKLFIFFYSINFLSLAIASENNDFYIKLNGWKQAKLIASEKLPDLAMNNGEERVEELTLKTESGINVPVKFYDRNSKICIIVASSLPASKEGMEVFAKLFSTFDVIIFDYRWANRYGTFLVKSILTGKPVKKVLLDSIEELETVVRYCTERKKYDEVVGLGECYSCFHLAKLQSDALNRNGKGPFTKLILDSCWCSLRSFAERICFDPFLPCSPQCGGAPRVISWMTDSYLFKRVILGLVFALINNFSLQPYIANVGIPVLFVHGRKDLFVPPDHFNKIWNAADKDCRAVFFTPYQHADNLGNKNLYRFIVEKFVTNRTMQDFEKNYSELA